MNQQTPIQKIEGKKSITPMDEEHTLKNTKLQKEKAKSIRLLNDKSKEKQEEKRTILEDKNPPTKKGKRKKGTTIDKIILILFLILATNIVEGEKNVSIKKK